MWYYGDALRDAVWDIKRWVNSHQTEEFQQPVLDAFDEFHDALEPAVFIADVCELRHYWQHAA